MDIHPYLYAGLISCLLFFFASFATDILLSKPVQHFLHMLRLFLSFYNRLALTGDVTFYLVPY